MFNDDKNDPEGADNQESPASLGGIARREALTPTERKEIARKAARKRWEGKPLKVLHEGELRLGALSIPCAVLDGGIRVVSQAGFYSALGTGNLNRRGLDDTFNGPPFLAVRNLKPFISEDLAKSAMPVLYKPIGAFGSGNIGYGIRAELIPEVCDVWLKAREKKVLHYKQKAIAEKAEIVMRGLAHVGIIALVDEATGYQEVRDRLALQAILDAFLRKEAAAWAKRFPDEFYQHIFRLRGWEWRGMKVNRPGAVAQYTKDLVYARLEAGVLDELENRNPMLSSGRRAAKHHQFFTEDIGHPALARHIHAVMGFMRASKKWPQFMTLLDLAFPKKGDTLSMAFMADIDGDRTPET